MLIWDIKLLCFLVLRRYANVVSFSSSNKECLPGNADLQSKLRDVNKGDEYSSKLAPKSQYAAQDAFLKVKIRILWEKEICKKRYDFICRIRIYFSPF